MTFDREKQRLLAIGGKWEHMKGVTLSPEVISFLTDALGFPNMAPVQSQCIPLLLSHYDTVVEAVTGSGKTLAYLVPMMEMMMREKNIEVSNNNAQAVLGAIVVPSRELAQQVFKVAKKFVAYINKEKKTVFTTACFIGGRSLEVDIDIFNSHGANILIGTPGRLYELLVASKYSHLFNVGSLELLILDEADKLLELGFKPKLDALLKRFPKQRRTGLFSATQTQEVAELARAGMRNPVSIAVRVASISTVGDDEAKPQIPDTITNYYAIRKTEDKMDALVSFIENNKKEKILVYAMTCAAVEWMSECLSKVLLKSKGVNLFTIHGQMKLSCRQKAFSSVNEANSCVLVCTDVAARGLDIPEVGIVIQYDAPVSPSTFIHRIGRTARMGRAGKSLILLSPNEAEYVSFMKLQNVTLVPFTEEDDREENDFANVDPKRTLASAPKKKMIHNHKKNKQDKTVSIKKELMALNKGKKRLRGEVSGDMCESPSITALRRASREYPQLVSLASRAFVSFIRAYKEHECRYIFQLKRLDITSLVHSFALFKVPNCGEIRKMSILRIPIQEEFNDILDKLKEQRKIKKESEDQQRKEAEQAAADGDDRLLKKHRTDRNEALDRLKHDTTLTRGAKANLWRRAEIDEIMKESYYIKKEKMGKISSKLMDSISGTDAYENATMSTRERQQANMIRSKK